MKQIEAFSFGKKFGFPELNEDSMVIMQDRGYAVIDGVTDRNGTRYDGMLSGQFASTVVRRAVEQFLIGKDDPLQPSLHYKGPKALIQYFNEAIRLGYEHNNALATVEGDWKVRAGCTVMIAFHHGDDLEIVAVGDSGIRINGSDIIQPLKALDDVTAILRRETWHYFEEKGIGADDCNRIATDITWQGILNQPHNSEVAENGTLQAIEERTLNACRQQLRDVPDWELLELLHHGIAHGQGNFQNVADRALGYGAIDGFSVPEKFIVSKRYPLSQVNVIELFSDGYFEPGESFGVNSWEESFLRIEREDPNKIGRYMSTKGTTDMALTDDRTYLGVIYR